MTLYSRQFVYASDLATFVNANSIAAANILKIETDVVAGGWVLFWWA